jgi:plastocyanin
MERVRSNTATVIVIAILSILMLQACGDGDSGVSDEGARPNEDGEMSLLLRNFAFEPRTLLFEVGDTVQFSLATADSLHTFTVEELGIDWRVRDKDEPVQQSFTFDRPGTFRLICAIPGHEGSGMAGTVEVRPSDGSAQ